MENKIRKSAIAGSWYPDDAGILQASIHDFIGQVPEESIDGRVIGIVVPHAGHAYSGQVAAYAYKLLMGQLFDAVVVIGPSHRIPFQGVSVYRRGGYETPLGIVPIDGPLVDRIMAESSSLWAADSAHLQEHSIEIQLPFLQSVLGDFSFVPLLMGSQDRNTCEALASVIVKALDNKRVLVVGSSDLSHFHSYDQALKLDLRALAYLEKMDAQGFLQGLATQEFEACGGGPAAVTLMVAAKLGATRAKLLRYANSGDVTGDRKSVVGYGAVVFSASQSPGEAEVDGDAGENPVVGLTAEDKAILMGIVSSVIEARLAWKKTPATPKLSEILRQERGAFVTLRKRGRLRGCIGYIEARKPLYKTIEEMAAAAAFCDPRFPPLTQDEWRDIAIEISILSPLREIHDIQEIEVGRHGIYIVRGSCCGLLLPQVAVEYGWDRLTFLQQTCHKAGLPPQSWKDKDTKIFIFSAEIFSSDE